MIDLGAICRVLAFRWRFRRWSIERVRRWQLARASARVRWAAKHLPYYRELWRDFDLSRPWDLPTTCKRELMANLAGANALGASWDELAAFRQETDRTRSDHRLFRGRYNVELSAGTSGTPGIFVFSSAERSVYGAMIAARSGVPRTAGPLRAVVILRVDGASFRGVNAAGVGLQYLSLATPIPEMVRFLSEAAPNVLAGQPWVLRELAREQRAGRLSLRLAALVPVAEVLEPDVRADLADAFGAPIRELYQASEGLIGSSCESGRMHVNEDFVAVQLADADGREVEAGEPARRLVVTDLYRWTQPILRYELNDMIELDPAPCPCGSSFRVIRRIHGRADDLLFGRATNGTQRPILPDYFRRAIVRSTEAIEEYQVIATAPNHLDVRLELRAGADATAAGSAVRTGLAHMYAEHDCIAPAIDIADGPPELHPESRKLRRIIRAYQ